MDTTKSNADSDGGTTTATEGSWTPLLVVLLMALVRWLAVGTSALPVRVQRFFKLQRIQWRNRLGLRDDSAYRSGAAGHGASQSVKRQG